MHSENNTTQEYITDNLQLPNHQNELSKAEDIIAKLKVKVEVISITNSISADEHLVLYDEIIRVLDYVGRLSMPVFAIEDDMEKAYTLKYKRSPALAKKLCYDHYEDLHRDYNKLKNRCFKLLDDLDESYIKINNEFPSNWNW